MGTVKFSSKNTAVNTAVKTIHHPCPQGTYSLVGGMVLNYEIAGAIASRRAHTAVTPEHGKTVGGIFHTTQVVPGAVQCGVLAMRV